MAHKGTLADVMRTLQRISAAVAAGDTDRFLSVLDEADELGITSEQVIDAHDYTVQQLAAPFNDELFRASLSYPFHREP